MLFGSEKVKGIVSLLTGGALLAVLKRINYPKNPYLYEDQDAYERAYNRRVENEKFFLEYFKKRVENPQYRHPCRGGTEIPDTLHPALLEQVEKISPRPHAKFELKLRFEKHLKHFCYLDVLKDGKTIPLGGRFRHFDENKWSVALCNDRNKYVPCCLKDGSWFCSFKEAIRATEDLRKLGFVQDLLNGGRYISRGFGGLLFDTLTHLFFSLTRNLRLLFKKKDNDLEVD
jgi:hypothetical protein